MLSIFLAAIMASGPQASAGRCGPTSLPACTTTNDLIWNDEFKRKLKRFLGARKASYLYRNGSLYEQAKEVLNGPPDEPTRLSDKSWIFTACRSHSCPEKGAVVLSSKGDIIAVGILHFSCGAPTGPEDSCADVPRLALIMARGVPSRSSAAGVAITRWAHSSDPKLVGTDVSSQ